MKATSLVVPLVALLLAGCDDSTRQPGSGTAPASSGSATNAPVDYFNSAGKSQKQAIKTVDLAAINKAIEAFYVQEGRFPKTLEELVDKNCIRKIPVPPLGVKIVYDTNNGLVSLEKE